MDFSHAFKMTTDNVPLYERGCPKDWGFLSVCWIKNPPPRRIAWHLLSKRRTTFFTAFEMTVNCHSEERKWRENPRCRRFVVDGFLTAFEMTIGRNDKNPPAFSIPLCKGGKYSWWISHICSKWQTSNFIPGCSSSSL